jgi:hypothetical protein
MNEVINSAYQNGQLHAALSVRRLCTKLDRDKVNPELWLGLITEFCEKFVNTPDRWYDEELGIPKFCDVCGSDNITYAPHMGKNCNLCHPLELEKKITEKNENAVPGKAN